MKSYLMLTNEFIANIKKRKEHSLYNRIIDWFEIDDIRPTLGNKYYVECKTTDNANFTYYLLKLSVGIATFHIDIQFYTGMKHINYYTIAATKEEALNILFNTSLDDVFIWYN